MSETRYRSKGVFVRFTPAQFEELRDQAELRGITVPELLRDRSMVTDRAAS